MVGWRGIRNGTQAVPYGNNIHFQHLTYRSKSLPGGMHECIPYEHPNKHPDKQQFTTLRMKTDRCVSSSKTHLLSILSYPTAQIIPGVSLGYAPTPNPAPQPSKNKKRPSTWVRTGVFRQKRMDFMGICEYAWFVASGTVKAEGMNVQAQSDGNLVIRYKGTEWVSVATATDASTRTLRPTSTIDLSKWVWAKAQKSTASTAEDSTFQDKSSTVRPATWGKDDEDDSSAGGCKDNGYALVKYFQIRAASDSSTPMGLYVPAITVTGAENTMSTALRVGVECKYKGETEVRIFAPVTIDTTDQGNEPTREYQVMVPATADGKTTFSRSSMFKVATIASKDETEAGKATNAVLIGSETPITKSDIAEVYIYVWMEGEDANLKSDNFYADELSVSVEFTSFDQQTT